MLSAASLALAGALTLWPGPASPRRLRALTGKRAAVRWRAPNGLLVITAAAAVGLVLLGVGGALASVLVSATGYRHWRGRRTVAAATATVAGLAEALRSLVAELRVGAHPADAADSAASDAHPVAAQVMRTIAVTVRLGGDVAAALRGIGLPAASAAAALDHLTRAWSLAARHGLPLADLLDAVRGDLDQRVRFTNQVTAKLAGPRASAMVLATLPAVGIALGEAAGARPLHLLATTPTGQLLLVIGSALACAGLAWTNRITTTVALK